MSDRSRCCLGRSQGQLVASGVDDFLDAQIGVILEDGLHADVDGPGAVYDMEELADLADGRRVVPYPAAVRDLSSDAVSVPPEIGAVDRIDVHRGISRRMEYAGGRAVPQELHALVPGHIEAERLQGVAVGRHRVENVADVRIGLVVHPVHIHEEAAVRARALGTNDVHPLGEVNGLQVPEPIVAGLGERVRAVQDGGDRQGGDHDDSEEGTTVHHASPYCHRHGQYLNGMDSQHVERTMSYPGVGGLRFFRFVVLFRTS